MYHRAKLVKALSSRSQARQPKPSKATAKAARPTKAAKPAAKPAARSATVKAAPKAATPIKAVAKTAKAASPAPKAAAKSAPPIKNGSASKLAAAAPAPAKAASKPAAASKAEAATPTTLPPPSAKKRKSIKEAAGVSTDAVMRRTGKSWDDWFEVLDTAGAQTLDQRGVIAILAQKHGIGPWWQQMIAVGYESLRAKSDKPPAPDGFHINSSCTLNAPVTRVFRLWNDAGERARWLADDRFVVRGATADKVIRARWGKGTSHVAVSFSEKSGRTEVSVEHHQIETSAAAEQMKAYWAKKLGLLDQALAPRR